MTSHVAHEQLAMMTDKWLFADFERNLGCISVVADWGLGVCVAVWIGWLPSRDEYCCRSKLRQVQLQFPIWSIPYDWYSCVFEIHKCRFEFHVASSSLLHDLSVQRKCMHLDLILLEFIDCEVLDFFVSFLSCDVDKKDGNVIMCPTGTNCKNTTS